MAEDNPVNQEVAKAMLSRLGLNTVIAHDGKQAVDLIRNHHYDIILMDCQMPVMDGFEATAQIRQQLNKIPIIALTANATEDDRTQCLNAGMDDFLSKPYTLDQLQQKILQWLPQEKGNPMNTEKSKSMAIKPDSSTVPVLNPVRLEQIRELDPTGESNLLQKILQAFLDSADNSLQQLELAILHNDTESLRQSAHTLKSSSGNIGAESLSAIFKQLEIDGRSGELTRAKALQENMRSHYQSVVAEIRKILTPS